MQSNRQQLPCKIEPSRAKGGVGSICRSVCCSSDAPVPSFIFLLRLIEKPWFLILLILLFSGSTLFDVCVSWGQPTLAFFSTYIVNRSSDYRAFTKRPHAAVTAPATSRWIKMQCQIRYCEIYFYGALDWPQRDAIFKIWQPDRPQASYAFDFAHGKGRSEDEALVGEIKPNDLVTFGRLLLGAVARSNPKVTPFGARAPPRADVTLIRPANFLLPLALSQYLHNSAVPHAVPFFFIEHGPAPGARRAVGAGASGDRLSRLSHSITR
ncbi:hypothetical protein EVAR_35211_1 [Eumeta japonica]|uniref:Uncharacterized protein n=1 Tax=Eumeta variegata TaxID=151549 RepID=A0A4C1VEG5_EUMVA|nr:hypothetical protein EVAR_35211_1 [Eumeta japonica]